LTAQELGKDMSEGKDNREYPRAQRGIELSFDINNGDVDQKSITRDISATGISFEVNSNIPNGTIIMLRIFLTEIQRIINAKSTSTRSWVEDGKTYVSVQFMDIDYHDFILLLDYSLAYQSE
jgi:hypothetical protein